MTSSLHLYSIYIILFVFILSNQDATSQQKINLDFEELSVEGVSRPWGWTVYSYAPGVTFICDSLTTKSGKYSLRVSSEQMTDPSRFELSFFIEPNQILNNKITVEGWAKSVDFNGTSGISIKSVGTIGNEYGTLNEKDTEIQDSDEWKPYKAEIGIDSKPHTILVTLFFEGTGTIWFDGLRLKINEKTVREVPVAQKFSTAQLTQIAKETDSFKTVEPSSKTDLQNSDFKDLDFFKSLAGDAKIIALGESTHGTSEFFKVKHRLLQYAILKLGVRVFVLEDNQLIVERINNYVLYGTGEAENVIKGLFAVWNTAEMLELIKWLRQYNIKHPKTMVEFVGMDVQNPQLALEALNDFLRKKDTLLQNKSSNILAEITTEWRNSYFKNDSILNKWDRDAEKNFNLVFSHKEQWLSEAANKSDSLIVEWAIKNARTIKQFVETALGGIYEGRDKAMAENIEWIINQRNPNTKILIWAHDSHISRGDNVEASSNFFFGKSMGSYLSKKFKEKYRSFGLFTYQGTCLGTISYSNFTQLPFKIYTSPNGSLDEALHQISNELGKKNLIMNLRRFKNNSPSFEWITRKRPVRYVGYVAEDYGFGGRYSIPFQFDGIIFIDSSQASNKIN
jgi:erythromycin esterase